MAALPPMPNLLAFEAVARRRSFALAAAELHLTASAISHQIARLETHLAIKLFERSAHGVRLSPAGEHYLSRVAGALSAIAAASDDLRQGVSNSLYVHCSPSLATLWLMPRLHLFAQAHPDISLNLSAAHTHSDFALGQVDMDIRYGVPQWPNLVVEPLFEERIVPLASAAFIRKHRLKRPDQLLRVPLIQSNVSVVQWSDWFARVLRQACARPLHAALRPRAHVIRRRRARARRGPGKHDDGRHAPGRRQVASGAGHGQVDPREGALRGLPGAPRQAPPRRGLPVLVAR